jgi:hypothetical protein
MSDAYTPREGTLPALVIAHLESQEAGYQVDNAYIVENLGGNKSSVATQLKKALVAGLLVAEKSGKGWVYSLPEAPAPTNGKLDIVTYADGDVGVSGMAITEDGAVFTREQLVQLLTHVTTPHVQMPGRAPCSGMHE